MGSFPRKNEALYSYDNVYMRVLLNPQYAFLMLIFDDICKFEAWISSLGFVSGYEVVKV